MHRPRLLDLFSGAGGAGEGYRRAGFDVTGVDIKPQPRYKPGRFIQGDALEYLEAHGREYDVIHASPPCQAYTMAQNAAKNAHAHPDLVEPVRNLLIASGRPYIIENVVGAPLIDPFFLCGITLGVKVRRHRLFESNIFVLAPPHLPCNDYDYYVIFGNEVRNRRQGAAAGRKNSRADGRAAMGIDWMTRAELSQAIPPAYTEYIGIQLLRFLEPKRMAVP
jgi:DNA (cytosine-5)-methyltransferase 1